jgi:AcrR family transcriptional regulator
MARHVKSPESDRSTARTGEGQRLRRAARREQILAAAARAFARAGFTATSLDDVAREAGVTRAILYRHFDSKADLYRAVLDRARHRLARETGAPSFSASSIDGLLTAAAEDPDGFRLLFHHAAREPEFRAEMDELQRVSIGVALDQLADHIPDPAWARWAAQVVAFTVIESVMAWLDAGQPERDRAAARIWRVVAAIIRAARR